MLPLLSFLSSLRAEKESFQPPAWIPVCERLSCLWNTGGGTCWCLIPFGGHSPSGLAKADLSSLSTLLRTQETIRSVGRAEEMSHLHCSDWEGGCGLFWDPARWPDLPVVLLLLVATPTLLTLLVNCNSFSQKYFQIHTLPKQGNSRFLSRSLLIYQITENWSLNLPCIPILLSCWNPENASV